MPVGGFVRVSTYIDLLELLPGKSLDFRERVRRIYGGYRLALVNTVR